MTNPYGINRPRTKKAREKAMLKERNHFIYTNKTARKINPSIKINKNPKQTKKYNARTSLTLPVENQPTLYFETRGAVLSPGTVARIKAMLPPPNYDGQSTFNALDSDTWITFASDSAGRKQYLKQNTASKNKRKRKTSRAKPRRYKR